MLESPIDLVATPSSSQSLTPMMPNFRSIMSHSSTPQMPISHSMIMNTNTMKYFNRANEGTGEKDTHQVQVKVEKMMIDHGINSKNMDALIQSPSENEEFFNKIIEEQKIQQKEDKSSSNNQIMDKNKNKVIYATGYRPGFYKENTTDLKVQNAPYQRIQEKYQVRRSKTETDLRETITMPPYYKRYEDKTKINDSNKQSLTNANVVKQMPNIMDYDQSYMREKEPDMRLQDRGDGIRNN
ncbi:uncharacterized protein LOC135930388 [Gordionus sp. m RMFG-2023]|uniref:uncharacterized protein LOC135930388 n=1 Tax=Gordionus sp. m RMFG-2023 TaxID=3053472 RepID=UPI0031FD6916